MLVIRYFSDLLAAWRNEDLTKMSYIRGYSNYLLKGEFGTLTDEQRQAVEVIHRSCMQTVEDWHQRGRYFFPLDLCPISVTEIIELVLEYLHGSLCLDREHVQVALGPNLPPVAGSLMSAIGIIGTITHLYRPGQNDFRVTLKANAGEDNVVVMQIQVRAANLPSKADLSLALSRPDTDLCMANVLIRQHGSEIKVTSCEGSIVFEFALPPAYPINPSPQPPA